MLISPNKVKASNIINLNVSDNEIGNAIRISQNVYLVDIIGLPLVEKLQELVYNKIKGLPDSIDDQENEKYKVLLDEYVTPVLVYRTAVELCVFLTLKIRNAGVVKNSDTNVNATSPEEMKYLKDYIDAFHYDAVNKMVAFLCENSKAYPENKFDCGCGDKPLYARTGLYLGK